MEESEDAAEVTREGTTVAAVRTTVPGEVPAVADQEAALEAGPRDQAVVNHPTIATQDRAEHNASLDGFKKQSCQKSLVYQPCQIQLKTGTLGMAGRLQTGSHMPTRNNNDVTSIYTANARRHGPRLAQVFT